MEFDPLDNHRFATFSEDGLVKIWDMRVLHSKASPSSTVNLTPNRIVQVRCQPLQACAALSWRQLVPDSSRAAHYTVRGGVHNRDVERGFLRDGTTAVRSGGAQPLVVPQKCWQGVLGCEPWQEHTRVAHAKARRLKQLCAGVWRAIRLF